MHIAATKLMTTNSDHSTSTYLRPAVTADLAMIAAGELSYMREIEPAQESAWVNALGRNVALWIKNLHRTAILEMNGNPAGYLIWARDDSVATLVTINVLPVFRHRGGGNALLERFVEDASSAGLTTLRLGVHRSNESARRLYEHAGFTHTHDDGDYLLYEVQLDAASQRQQPRCRSQPPR